MWDSKTRYKNQFGQWDDASSLLFFLSLPRPYRYDDELCPVASPGDVLLAIAPPSARARFARLGLRIAHANGCAGAHGRHLTRSANVRRRRARSICSDDYRGCARGARCFCIRVLGDTLRRHPATYPDLEALRAREISLCAEAKWPQSALGCYISQQAVIKFRFRVFVPERTSGCHVRSYFASISSTVTVPDLSVSRKLNAIRTTYSIFGSEIRNILSV